MNLNDANTVGRWKLANGTWSDDGGQGNNYTLTATGSPTQVAGKDGTANAAVGLPSGAYLSIADTPALSVSGAFTIAGWFYITTVGTRVLASKSNATGNQRSWILQTGSAGTPSLYVYSNGSTGANTATTGSNFSAEVFRHIAAIYDGTSIIMYINGVKFSTVAYSSGIYDSNAPFVIGANNTDATPTYLNGGAQDVIYSNRAFSEKEIANLYALRDGFYNPPNTFPDITSALLAGIDRDTYTSVTSSTLTITGLRGDDRCYAAWDYGENFFSSAALLDTLVIDFDFNISSISGNGAIFSGPALGDTLMTYNLVDASTTMNGLFIGLNNPSSTVLHNVYIYDQNNGVQSFTTGITGLATALARYARLSLVSGGSFGVAKVEIYAEAGRTTLLGTATVNLTKNHNLQYLFAHCAWDAASNSATTTATISNFAISGLPVTLATGGTLDSVIGGVAIDSSISLSSGGTLDSVIGDANFASNLAVTNGGVLDSVVGSADFTQNNSIVSGGILPSIIGDSTFNQEIAITTGGLLDSVIGGAVIDSTGVQSIATGGTLASVVGGAIFLQDCSITTGGVLSSVVGEVLISSSLTIATGGTLNSVIGEGIFSQGCSIATGGTLSSVLGTYSFTQVSTTSEVFSVTAYDTNSAKLTGAAVWLEVFDELTGLQLDFADGVFKTPAGYQQSLLEVGITAKYTATVDTSNFDGWILLRIWYVNNSPTTPATYGRADARVEYANGHEITRLSRASQISVDAIPTTPLLAASYVAPDNAGISTIIAQTDTLEAGIAAVPTAAENAAAVWAKAVEGLTAEEIMRVMLAALAGKRQGIGTSTEQYLAQDGITPRISLTPTDSSGNGSPIINGAP